MKDTKPKPLKIFLLTVVFTAIILLIRISIHDYFGDKHTYIMFYPFVMLSALLGGWIAGTTALAILAMGSSFFLLPPDDRLIIYNREDLFGFFIFIFGGLLMTFICESFLRTKQKFQNQTLILQKLSNKLQDSKEQLQTILENVADGIIVRDNKGKPVYINSATYELLNIPKQKRYLQLSELDKQFIITDSYGKRLHTKDLLVTKVLDGVNNAESILCYINKKTKVETWFMVKARGIYDEGKKIKNVVIVFIDITERKNIERQKDDFIGIASHELKTPVTALKMYVQALERRFAKEGSTVAFDFLKRMDNQISRLEMLIRDLLDVTKIESGKLPLQIERFEINNLIQETAAEIQVTATKHKIKLELDKPAFVNADQNRIGQVLVNLLTNAIKYSPEANAVIVKTEVQKKLLTVRVVDFGIGIPEKSKAKIFQRFYREGDGQNKAFPGLGLGLYITSEIIKRHHGNIWVENNGKKGSIFAFSLPLVK